MKKIQDRSRPEGRPETSKLLAIKIPGKYGDDKRTKKISLTLRESGKLSYKGHTVNALVLEGDEGRDKLR